MMTTAVDRKVDVLVVTALKIELDAVLDLGEGGRSGWEPMYSPSRIQYYQRDFPRKDGRVLRVAALWVGEMGSTAAATEAAMLTLQLDPVCVGMSGICAGLRGEVSLGDVIVAERLYRYEDGKGIVTIDDNDHRREEFYPEGQVFTMDPDWKRSAALFSNQLEWSRDLVAARPVSLVRQESWLLRKLAELPGIGRDLANHPERPKRCPDWRRVLGSLREKELLTGDTTTIDLTEKGRYRVDTESLEYPDGLPEDPPFRVHVGVIASGSKVVEDPGIFKQLKRRLRKTIAIEMEAAAIGYVANRLHRNVIIAKAVSDYADHTKDDAYQPFAARASAEFLLAFLSKHPPPIGRTAEPQGDADFLHQVMEISAVRFGRASRIRFVPTSAPFDKFVEVCELKDGFLQTHPVAAVDQSITQDILDSFIKNIDAQYRAQEPGMISTLVYRGERPVAAVAEKATQHRVKLSSFMDYETLIDFEPYLAWQREQIESDPAYTSERYVAQRLTIVEGSDGVDRNAIDELVTWLQSPHVRFGVVLGSFGTGKTFLLRELTRRMSASGNAVIPILMEMRFLEKARSLDELVASHFARSRMDSIDLRAFNFMLARGRIALLFDGFDELNLRVGYDRAADHFDTLIKAATSNAKIVVTSRSQHFISDQQIRTAIHDRLTSVQGHRLAKIEPFTAIQVEAFVRNRLGSDTATGRWLTLLEEMDLGILAQTPRMLGLLLEIPEEQIRGARDRGEIGPAGLYGMILERWMDGEVHRVNQRGAAPGLNREQLQEAATAVALLLWRQDNRTIRFEAVPPDLMAAAEMLAPQQELGITAQQIGSGTLLVRDGLGNFSFIQDAMLEYLVACEAAKEVKEKGDSSLLGVNSMSDTMVDFFRGLAGSQVAIQWAEQALGASIAAEAKRNAFRVLARLHTARVDPHTADAVVSRINSKLDGTNLRGMDLSARDLRMADMNCADLTAATLIGADLRGASLVDARLIGANLTGARLEDADLRGADLTDARLLGANLKGARVEGTKFHLAKLVGATLEASLAESVRAINAAPPTPERVEPMTKGITPSRGVAFSANGEWLASAHGDGSVLLWEVATARATHVFRRHESIVVGIAFSSDGLTLASASYDNTIRLWDVPTRSLRRVLESPLRSVSSVAFGGDGSLASGVTNATAYIWDISAGKPRSVFNARSAVLSVAFSHDGETIATGCSDGVIRIWSVKSGRLRTSLKGNGDSVFSIAFGPGSSSLAAGSYDHTVTLWDLNTNHVRFSLRGHTGRVVSVAFSKDGTLLASGAYDGTVRLWDTSAGAVRRVLTGHTAHVHSVALSHDGALVVSASDDGTLRLWDTADGTPLVTFLHAPDGWITFTPDGRYKRDGDVSGAFWHQIGGCRFEPGELDPYLPSSLRVADSDPLVVIPGTRVMEPYR